MQVFIRAFALAFALGIVAIALGLFSTHPAGAAGSAPVMVTNTPLPVQGTVGAAQSGAWNVGINGTPNVNVAGLPAVQFNGTQPVTFSNAEANPIFTRDVDSAGRPGVTAVHPPTSLPYQAERDWSLNRLTVRVHSIRERM